MSLLTRKILDKILPRNIHLENKARRIVGIPNGKDPRPLEACLLWLADMSERDQFSGFGRDVPAWRKPPSTQSDWWDISIDGLCYKQSSHYLTAQGWPTGTVCWYVCLDGGWREYIAAEEPTLAAMRAVVVMHCWREWRNIPPDERPDFIKYVEEFMAQ